MAEYIDKQAFNDAIREAVRRFPNTFYNGLETARQIAHDLPAADVRPVVRASWEEKEKDGVWWYACSVCGEHIPKGRWGQEWHSNFCPNCGAYMREPPKEET